MNIVCNYCRASNGEDDHRCRRCGRRLQQTPAQGVVAGFGPTQTATARALRVEPAPVPQTVAPAVNPPADAPARPAYQRPLFSSKEVPQVVAFESIAPKTVAPKTVAPKPPARYRGPRTEVPPRPRPRRPPVPGQQSLEFSAPQRPVDTAVEAVIYCDARVASRTQRALAAAIDVTLIVIALSLFLGIFRTMGGEIAITRNSALFLLGIAALLGFLYKTLCCLGEGESAGMHWARLRLVNFDGQKPGWEQRLYRLSMACLSFCAAGLGVLWALVDEESLTWHDHISKTFPTSY